MESALNSSESNQSQVHFQLSKQSQIANVISSMTSVLTAPNAGGLMGLRKSPTSILKKSPLLPVKPQSPGNGAFKEEMRLGINRTKGTERLAREFRSTRVSGPQQVRELKLCDSNLYHWKFLLIPEMAPYNKAAFQAEIQFPDSYPLKPPTITVHNIYHPNIDKTGYVCLHCLAHWARTMKIEDVLQKLFALIRDPEPHHPIRFDVADEFLKDRQSYLRKAAEAAKQFGVTRPKF